MAALPSLVCTRCCHVSLVLSHTPPPASLCIASHLLLQARADAISLEEMAGGTFTISNGGVFGSMMGTPIINPPQSAILGMHATKMRPVAIGVSPITPSLPLPS